MAIPPLVHPEPPEVAPPPQPQRESFWSFLFRPESRLFVGHDGNPVVVRVENPMLEILQRILPCCCCYCSTVI